MLIKPVTGLAAETPERPDAGKTLEGLKRPELNLPAKPAAEVRVEESSRPPQSNDSGVKFKVNKFHLTGQKVFREKDLQNLIADGKEKEITLADLDKLAGRLTDFYHKHGYIMAQAYVPAQRIENGTVDISIIIGHYDKIVVRKHVTISDEVIRTQLGAVKSGALIEKSALEKVIWLINDLAGVEARATLAPGGKAGTADLILDINAKDRSVSGNISIDNFGNRFTGTNEVSTGVTFFNPARQGDTFAFYGLTAGGGLASGSISYQLPLATQGGKLEVSYSRMRYELGEDFASLNASGMADSISLACDYTLKRSRRANLYGQVGYTHKKLQDVWLGFTTDKRSDVLTFTVNGDSIDNWGGGGANSYSLGYSHGHLTAADQNSRQAGTPGTFGKWNLTLARQQYINDRLSLVSYFTGQVAAKNLDSAEKMSLGGPYGVRAYPKGEASGDSGYLWTNELRWTIPKQGKRAGSWQLVGFYDLGSVIINKNDWVGTGTANRRTLQGAGCGLIWSDPGKFTARISYAWKIGAEKAKSDTDKSGRLWCQFTKYI